MTHDDQRPPEPPPAPSNEQPKGDQAGGNDLQQYPAPEGPRMPDPNMIDARELRSAQNLILAASIIGPISLIFASLLFSVAGLTCGYLGFRKLKALEAKHTGISGVATRMKRSAIIAMSICGVATVLNVVLLWVLFPSLMEFIETGDYGNLLSGNGGSSAGTNSTWG